LRIAQITAIIMENVIKVSATVMRRGLEQPALRSFVHLTVMEMEVAIMEYVSVTLALREQLVQITM
jgi:hypothetical protein